MDAELVVCGLVRIHAWRARDEFRLLDVPKKEASKVMRELRAAGWKLVYTEVL